MSGYHVKRAESADSAERAEDLTQSALGVRAPPNMSRVLCSILGPRP